jgi:hypothetical protein
MISYHEALSRCLEAVRLGRDLESVITTLPQRHAQSLREDATLAQAVRRHAATLPAPSADAQRQASARLFSELAAARVERQPASTGNFWSGFGFPRFAIAGLLLAAVLVGASFFVYGNNAGDVEAATLEGVVVASGADSLTIQTLDTLEQVTVPLDARVSDETGAKINAAAIEVGQVVLIHGNRKPGGPVKARQIERLLNGLSGWCSDNAPRCRQLAQGLETAQERCQSEPQACRVVQERFAQLIAQVTNVASLEELKQRCGESGEASCQDFIAFCRLHTDLCITPDPPAPVIDRIDEARDRLVALNRLCAQRDTKACRQIAQICDSHPVLCPDAPKPPVDIRPSVAATPRPAPTATPKSDQRPGR